jgi:hypothetical protein
MRSIRSTLAAATITAMVMGACSASVDPSASEPGDDPAATASTTLDDGMPPSDEALTADEAMRVVPDGYVDCGTVVLTSGWPTTTIFAPDAAACILDAADRGRPAQQAFTGRDQTGGMEGWLIRVDGPAGITMVEYRIDADGGTTSAETSCTTLETTPMGPPVCPEP